MIYQTQFFFTLQTRSHEPPLTLTILYFLHWFQYHYSKNISFPNPNSLHNPKHLNIVSLPRNNYVHNTPYVIYISQPNHHRFSFIYIHPTQFKFKKLKFKIHYIIIMFKYNILVKYNNVVKDKSILAFRNI